MTILQNEPLSKHTTIKIGRIARQYVIPQNFEELKTAIRQFNCTQFMRGKFTDI